MQLIDSHCHLDFPDFGGDLGGIFDEMRQNGVVGALVASVTLEDHPRLLALVESAPQLLGSVGVHPDHQACEEPSVERLLSLAEHDRVVAIGETGLDYYRANGDLEWQRERFRTHIRAAVARGLPLIVHTRAANEDTVRILRDERAEQVGGVMHCFTEDEATAKACLDLGFMISFSGIVSFKNAEALRSVARMVPEDSVLVETDSPYLAPVPHRGKLNRPGLVLHVAQALADARGVAVERIAEVSTANFLRLFPASSRLLRCVA